MNITASIKNGNVIIALDKDGEVFTSIFVTKVIESDSWIDRNIKYERSMVSEMKSCDVKLDKESYLNMETLSECIGWILREMREELEGEV